MRSHKEYKEMLSAHALGTLDAEEAREIEAYLSKHEDLRDELKEWRDVASLLTYVAPVNVPSTLVRERLFANLPSHKEIVASAENNFSQTAKNVIPFPTKETRKSWNKVQTIMAIAASIVIVFLAALLWTSLQNNRTTQTEIADLKNRLNDTQKELEQARQEKEIVTSPDSIIVELKAANASPNTTTARLVFHHKSGAAVLTARNLPPVPAGKAYQIWYITDPKKPTPGKTFKPDASGNADLNDRIPVNDLNASLFAVTIEDEKGAVAPTSAIVLKSS